MCLYPKLIKNRKYVSNKKNQGNVPTPIDNRVLLVPAGCQKCIECRKQKARSWQIRLLEEIRTNKTGEFITLTFSNESIYTLRNLPELKLLNGYELDNEIAKTAVRRFLERWRKKYGKSIKHWLITELGHNGTENIHLHGIIFLNPEFDKKEQIQDLTKIWQYGFIRKGTWVNEQTVNYCTKYFTKIDPKHKEYTPKILCSAGIGSNYINRPDAKNNQYKPGNTKETYTTRQGYKLNLPIYFRNKIYSEEEREKLWLEKLDKEERWICGEKISIANGTENYTRLLNYHRSKNKELGYGDDSKNWDRIQYENNLRKLMLEKRLKKLAQMEST